VSKSVEICRSVDTELLHWACRNVSKCCSILAEPFISEVKQRVPSSRHYR